MSDLYDGCDFSSEIEGSHGSCALTLFTFWDVVFVSVCVENDICEDGVCSEYICWWLNVRESSLSACSELCVFCS